jgi:RNA polymerase sigma-70 factor (ECF subfamily)
VNPRRFQPAYSRLGATLQESPRDAKPPLRQSEPDAAIVQRIASGDAEAVSELYDGTSRLVLGLILRVLGNREVAEEVLLDVYTQVWRQAPVYDPTRGSPLAWLTTIARTRAIDRLRSGRLDLRRQQPLDLLEAETSGGDTPEEAATTAERSRLVRTAMDSLASEQRQAIELAYFSGLSHSEIATQLSQPLGTIKTRVRLGMMKLAGILRPILDKR